jgi:non-lysosomal glucosylceramidase
MKHDGVPGEGTGEAPQSISRTSRTNPDDSSAASASCCGPGALCSGIDRRQFIKLTGIGLASVPSISSGLSAMAGPFAAPGPGVQHFIPADKRLLPDWVASLTARGSREVYRGKELNLIGMPVGGIAAGQLYLCGDGTLGCWKIFNQRYFSGTGSENYRPVMPDRSIEQGFALAFEHEGRTVTRRLDRRGFPSVDFVGEYPFGFVRYAEEGCPVQVLLEAFSPFIPLNAKDSALPATVLRYTVRNTGERSVRVALAGWLANAVGFHSIPEYDIDALHRNRIVQANGRTLAVHTAEPVPAASGEDRPDVILADFEGGDYADWTVEGEAMGTGPAHGTFPEQQPVSGFEGKGLVNTFLGGDGPHGKLISPGFVIHRRFLNFLLGGGRHPEETCINLWVDGAVVRTATGGDSERLIWHSWDVREFEGKNARIDIVDAHSGHWGHINVDHIELSDRRRFGTAGTMEQLEDFGSMVLALGEGGASSEETQRLIARVAGLGDGLHVEGDRTYPASERHTSAIATRFVELAPEEDRTFTYVVAWHFPNRGDRGQMYTNWFASAEEVAHYVFDNIERLAGDTRKWHDTYYGGTLPYWLLDRLHSTVCNLATGTCQWWKNGRFWAWEGVGCCHGTCTHVWNYAQAPARLFPELERSARQMQDLGEALHENGLVGFRGERNGAYAADGQCGTVLKCYREHQMSADDTFLKRNWPRIKQVLEYSIRQDGDGDGLIDASQHNTYDINFHGANTFVGSLYLAALRAGEQMAEEVGDAAFARRLRSIFESGSRLTVQRVWNGEYFIQDVDLDKHPQCQYGRGCLSDQLFGQGWAHQLALGHLYPQDKVRQALQSIWKYNWAPDIGPQNAVHKPERWFVSPGEAGLFTCTWPKSEHLADGVRYRNEVWTGIEYQVAGHLIWEDMVTEGLAIVRSVHDRYHPLKHNPFNEVECGDHYARAMASWGVYLALCGYRYHGPKGRLGFVPRISPEDFRCAFTTAGGWGTFSQQRDDKRQTERIDLCWGTLRLNSLMFSVPPTIDGTAIDVQVNDRKMAAEPERQGDQLTVKLPEGLTLQKGDVLEVVIG